MCCASGMLIYPKIYMYRTTDGQKDGLHMHF